MIRLKTNSGNVSNIIPIKAFVTNNWFLESGYEFIVVTDLTWFWNLNKAMTTTSGANGANSADNTIKLFSKFIIEGSVLIGMRP